MKTTIILMTITLITSSAILPNPFVSENSCEPMGQQVVSALRNASPEEYLALFPSLAEFHSIMEENSLVYGENLEPAKEEFAGRYKNKVIPTLKKSFTSILEEGKRKGIDWSQIKFESVECNMSDTNFTTTPFTIVFSSGKKEYHISIDKAFRLNSVWKVGSEITLI